MALVVPAETVAWNDNWIYIHDTGVRTMRIQNFGSWSPYLVKDGRNVLGLEYTVDEGDESWTAADEELIETRQGGARAAGSGRPRATSRPATWCACRRRTRTTTSTTRPTSRPSGPGWSVHAANVFPVGRNGMHRYNNQDHSMYTAMLTVENLLGAHHDVWAVNVEEEYHEVDEGSRPPARA